MGRRILAFCAVVMLAGGCLSPPRAQAPIAQPDLTHRLEGVTFLLLEDAGWSPGLVQVWAAHLPQRLAACAIALNPPSLIQSGQRPPSPSTDWERDYQALAADQSHRDGPLFIFTDRLGVEGDIGGAAVTVDGVRGAAVIARTSASGRRFAAEQTLAHELGHMLGLDHAPVFAPDGRLNIDMMTPRGCLYCDFSPAQCAALRAHPMVREIEP